MKITTIEFDVVDRKTGEMQTVVGTTTEHNKYYSIREVTTRINAMNYNEVIADICSSAAQIRLLGVLLDRVDADNRLVILSQSKLAKELGYSRKVLSTLLTAHWRTR